MKDKKAIRKKIIILIIIIVGTTVIWFLYPFIQLSLFYIFTPKSELQIKIENYLDEYNRSCTADNMVKLDYYYEGGPDIHCDLKFSSEKTDDYAIIAFLLISTMISDMTIFVIKRQMRNFSENTMKYTFSSRIYE